MRANVYIKKALTFFVRAFNYLLFDYPKPNLGASDFAA